MECVIDYVYLIGAEGEKVIKELSVTGENVSQ
jgi:hypothetical protein